MKHLISLTRPRVLIAMFIALALITLGFIATPTDASAQTALSQCNGTDNVGGQAVECHYTVTNNLNGSETSSTISISECHGAANDPPTLVCTPSSSGSSELVTSIDQCNGSGNGGGGTVVCTVDVINNITGTETATAASVNQCNASGTGGGTEPTTLCNPFPANTTGATVTQCNEAGNGGGGTTRVQCTVDSNSTTTSVLNVTVNQCNGSGNGGGATVTCRTGITNNITAPEPEPEPEPSGPDGDGGSDDKGNNGNNGNEDDTDGGGNGDFGTAGGTGSGLGTGGSGSGITSQVTSVPQGGASAGGGSTSGVENAWLLLLGVVLTTVAIPTLVLTRPISTRV